MFGGRLTRWSKVRTQDAFRVDLDGGRPPFPSRPLAEGIDIPLPGQKELQEADALVAAGLVNAEQHQDNPSTRHL